MATHPCFPASKFADSLNGIGSAPVSLRALPAAAAPSGSPRLSRGACSPVRQGRSRPALFFQAGRKTRPAQREPVPTTECGAARARRWTDLSCAQPRHSLGRQDCEDDESADAASSPTAGGGAVVALVGIGCKRRADPILRGEGARSGLETHTIALAHVDVGRQRHPIWLATPDRSAVRHGFSCRGC